jgi:UDP-2,3-diacylglucosamine hydrolase
MKNWYFIADAHFSETDQEHQERLIDFLERNRDQMECLVILGDLFEFWFGFQDYIDPAYQPICDTLASLRKDGVGLIYLEGNHDFSLGPFFTDTLKGEVYPRDHELNLNGLRVFLAHGDGLDPGDLRYRIYRRVLKNRFIFALIRWVGPRLTLKIKKLISSRKWMHRRRRHKEEDLPDERFALQKCKEGMDVVILGHTHQPCEKSFVVDGRNCYYYNVGDWIQHFSYLQYHPQSGFRLETYRPASSTSGEGQVNLSSRVGSYKNEPVSPD